MGRTDENPEAGATEAEIERLVAVAADRERSLPEGVAASEKLAKHVLAGDITGPELVARFARHGDSRRGLATLFGALGLANAGVDEELKLSARIEYDLARAAEGHPRAGRLLEEAWQRMGTSHPRRAAVERALGKLGLR